MRDSVRLSASKTGKRLIVNGGSTLERMNSFGRMLIGLGVLLALIGVVMVLLGRTGLPLGRLPGDMSYRGKNVQVYFPLGTSILLSIVLSVIFYLLSRWRR